MTKKLNRSQKVDLACFLTVVAFGCVVWVIGIVRFFQHALDIQIVLVAAGLVGLVAVVLVALDNRGGRK